MFPVAVIAGAGWLFLFVVLLIVPPSPRPHEGGGPGEGRTARRGRTRRPDPGDMPPAVVSLLARRRERSGFGATLVDLAARGWFEVRAPAGPAGSAGPGGPALCVVPAETPGGPLTPFERRVVAHVALRAGARGGVPAPALSDGFGGGETEFMSAFREEVDAEARRLGLTRSRLSGRRIGLLLLLLLVPAAALVPLAAHGRGLAYAGGLYFAGLWVAVGVGVSRRRSASGQAALDHWRSAVAAPASGGGDGRVVAYAAALGAAPAALAVFAQGSTNVAWSSYRGSWQLLEIETNTWSWPWGCAISVAIALGPVLYFAAAIWLGTHGMVLLAEEMTGLVVAAGIAAGLAALARRAAFPRFAEFDGQVIRQWMVKGDSDSEDGYHVAIDDGTRDKAWDVSIGTERYRRLPPGTFVHARVNLRSRADVTVEPVEPPVVAQPLARVAADQVRAVTNGLPDPADLVLETEAAAILGGKVRGSHLDGAPGRTMAWQPPSTGRPMLRVEVRHAADAWRVPPTARPAPGVADGYLVSQGAAVTVSALTTLISIHGSVHIASEASLAGLLPVVEGRLRELIRRIDFNQY
jgi:hypothetical protein